MRHLSAERLAAVADEQPTNDEAAHLAQCAHCGAERDAYRLLVAGAALERDRTVAPLSSWGAISARLRAEGIVRTPENATTSSAASDVAPVLPFARTNATDASGVKPVTVPTTPEVATPVLPMRRRVMPVWAMRAAAGLALVAGGVLAGRESVTRRFADASGPTIRPERPPVGPFTAVSNSPVSNSPDFFRSTEEARLAMLQAEATYQAAMRYLAVNDSTLRPPIADPVEAYRTRLAKLDDAVEETRRALKLAPTNPALNDYYLTSVSARETTLRQIDDALPVNERVTRF
jgi:hypothetical protein